MKSFAAIREMSLSARIAAVILGVGLIALLIGALLDHYFLMGLAAGLVIVGFAVVMIDVVRSSLSRARRSAAAPTRAVRACRARPRRPSRGDGASWRPQVSSSPVLRSSCAVFATIGPSGEGGRRGE